MAIVDTASGVVTLKIVYYGPPGAGKTTNLEWLAPVILGRESGRLTPRQVGDNRLLSLEIPAGSLGQLMGLSTVVRLETMQGEVSSAGMWTKALANADGIVFVADSSPGARAASFKALSGIHERLEGRQRSTVPIPVVMQWNKRDLEDARPTAEMQTELNSSCFPSIDASSLRGVGVAETLIEILKRSIVAAHRRAGGATAAEAGVEQTVVEAIQRLSQSARSASIERFGATIERQSTNKPGPPPPPRFHHAAEGFRSGGAEAFSDSVPERTPTTPSKADVDRSRSESAIRMLAALEQATSGLADPSVSGLPRSLMAGLLAGCRRARGSLLLFRPGTPRMEEWEVIPGGFDPLNALQPTTGGTKAASLCTGGKPLYIGDLADQVFFDTIVEGTEHLKAALVMPLALGNLAFGGIIVYVTDHENPPTAAEQAFWKTAATVTSVYLAWQTVKIQAAMS